MMKVWLALVKANDSGEKHTARPTPLISWGGIPSIFSRAFASFAISEGDAMNLGSVKLRE